MGKQSCSLHARKLDKNLVRNETEKKRKRKLRARRINRRRFKLNFEFNVLLFWFMNTLVIAFFELWVQGVAKPQYVMVNHE